MDCNESVVPSGTSYSSSISYLEAETTIEIAETLPFTLSATCKVETIPVGTEGMITGVSTSFHDEEACIKGFRDLSSRDPEIWCYTQPLTLTSHSLAPTILEVSHGQIISFNVRISFE